MLKMTKDLLRSTRYSCHFYNHRVLISTQAAFSGHLDVLSELIAHRAEVDAQDYEDGTALHNAAYNGHLIVINILLSNQV